MLPGFSRAVCGAQRRYLAPDPYFDPLKGSTSLVKQRRNPAAHTMACDIRRADVKDFEKIINLAKLVAEEPDAFLFDETYTKEELTFYLGGATSLLTVGLPIFAVPLYLWFQ
eukprot:s46_g40.t1